MHFREIFNQLPRKDLLALSILLHDIGKGAYEHRSSPHSESGAIIAFDILMRLGYPQEDVELVCRVIKEHLTMSQVSHRRDISSVEEISRFIGKIKDQETLDILYLLTYADMNALGGGKFTAWNAGLLRELYNRTKQAFSMQGVVPEEAIEPRYLDMLDQFVRSNESIIVVSDIKEFQCKRLEFCTKDEPELLRRIAGTLTYLRCNILSANITSPKEGVVVDTIDFTSPDNFTNEEIAQNAHNAIINKELPIKVLQKLRGRITFDEQHQRRVQVLFDNESSSTSTVVDIFSPDRIGLLYDILGVFAEHKLDVRYAKISTDVDSVVDSFSLTYLSGGKITDDAELNGLKKAIYGIS